MLRRIHSFPGLLAGLLVMFMALSGAFLSLQPAIAQWQAGTAAAQLDVAALSDAVARQFPTVSRIVRQASGAVVAYSDGSGGQTATRIDPSSGAALGPYETSPVFAFMTELHRSLFLGQGGHVVAGLAALSMLVLSISGGLLLVTRLGGWPKVLGVAKGSFKQRLHVDIGRIALLALLLSGLTGAYMSLVSIGLVSTGQDGFIPFPTTVDGGTPAPVSTLAALQALPLAQLRELVFPAQGDPTDVFTITTNAGQGFVDQASGAMLGFVPNSVGQTVYEAFYTLHTGQGIAWLGLMLGLAALTVPVMSVSGALIWWSRRRNQPRLKHNVAGGAADTIILVGSEGNSTWGFAKVLHDALTLAGHRVHTAPMNSLARHYGKARRMFVLTATYGDGAAPQSASRFLSRLERFQPTPDLAFAVLGFGDRSFPHFCQFADDVGAALLATGMDQLQPWAAIDRQSSQSFAQWGVETGMRLGAPLHLVHTPSLPRTTRLELVDRDDYGIEVQAPTSVLRFAMPGAKRGGLSTWRGFGRRLPRFEVGDLVGILPPGSAIPRYYSLASASRDGVLEICVRKQTGGLCSEFLHALTPGDSIEVFVRSNPDFRPGRGFSPLIMIGAGTGIAPLAGFIRHNRHHRPVHLYWGGRDPRSDFLYAVDMAECLDDARLARFTPAFSRTVGGRYVQQSLRDDVGAIRDLVAQGARIMVCGGQDMAGGVRTALDDILAPLGHSAQSLKSMGRYLEDVY
ncbi:nitric oxide synthase [Devosia sp. Root436]|uniref:PepSY domain-containing protein n=1 Tax=Devosia sp. Root436 TaxID=1736537 RepID=UPI0006F3BF2B|nr:PepSY domain-containing protein [Devosia sp. Root436]KQX38028.1 nitric oxide synthase [Devosia sp. Root436]